MSRNFELLKRASKDERWRTDSAPQPRIDRTYEMRPVPEAHTLSREELVKLVQMVFLLPQEDSPKVVVFTAAASGNGCSSICAGVAEALAAQAEQPVCVVDSNLRYPSLHLCFDAENRRGLCEALSHGGSIREYVQKLAAPNLWFLPSGLRSSPVSGTLSYNRLAARMVELRQEFSYVLMDSPAINTFSDAITLGQSADGVILIVSANSTRKKAARNAKECLQAAGARLLGVVLNNRTYPIPQAMYDRF